MAGIERQLKKIVETANDEDDLAEELQTFIEDFDEADLAEFCELLASKIFAPDNDNEEDDE